MRGSAAPPDPLIQVRHFILFHPSPCLPECHSQGRKDKEERKEDKWRRNDTEARTDKVARTEGKKGKERKAGEREGRKGMEGHSVYAPVAHSLRSVCESL